MMAGVSLGGEAALEPALSLLFRPRNDVVGNEGALPGASLEHAHLLEELVGLGRRVAVDA